MSNDNPFSGPFAGAAGLGGTPLDGDEKKSIALCCPACKSTNFRAWTNEFGVMRQCLEPNCKNEWSGSTVTAGRSNFLDLYPQPMPGVPAPDDDYPSVQYTGAGFRDPSKNFGNDDDF